MNSPKFDSTVSPLSPQPRIHEIAKAAGCTGREMLDHARSFGCDAKTVSSKVLPVFGSVLRDSYQPKA